MTTARPIPSARRRGHALAGMAFACALILLAACGGGGGGGGGDAAFKLRRDVLDRQEIAERVQGVVGFRTLDATADEPPLHQITKMFLRN